MNERPRANAISFTVLAHIDRFLLLGYAVISHSELRIHSASGISFRQMKPPGAGTGAMATLIRPMFLHCDPANVH
jgi:hypothetical protein